MNRAEKRVMAIVRQATPQDLRFPRHYIENRIKRKLKTGNIPPEYKSVIKEACGIIRTAFKERSDNNVFVLHKS